MESRSSNPMQTVLKMFLYWAVPMLTLCGGTAAQPPADQMSATPRTISVGVWNQKAVSLPKPAYPPAAVKGGVGGRVSLEILIDVDGTVILAKPISGPDLLQSAAVDAAKRARFGPTLLNGLLVRLKAVLNYDFVLPVRKQTCGLRLKMLEVNSGRLVSGAELVANVGKEELTRPGRFEGFNVTDREFRHADIQIKAVGRQNPLLNKLVDGETYAIVASKTGYRVSVVYQKILCSNAIAGIITESLYMLKGSEDDPDFNPVVVDKGSGFSEAFVDENLAKRNTVSGGFLDMPWATQARPIITDEMKTKARAYTNELCRQTAAVSVQVLVGTDGDVLAAGAINGHCLMRPLAEKAAKMYRFRSAIYNGKLVKVSGLIQFPETALY